MTCRKHKCRIWKSPSDKLFQIFINLNYHAKFHGFITQSKTRDLDKLNSLGWVLLLLIINNAFTGYGNIAPLSDGGKVFCMVFAVFGIPMTAIMLTAFRPGEGGIFQKFNACGLPEGGGGGGNVETLIWLVYYQEICIKPLLTWQLLTLLFKYGNTKSPNRLKVRFGWQT